MELIIWRQTLIIFRHERDWSGIFGNELGQWTKTIAIVTVTRICSNMKGSTNIQCTGVPEWKTHNNRKVHRNTNISSIRKQILNNIYAWILLQGSL